MKLVVLVMLFGVALAQNDGDILTIAGAVLEPLASIEKEDGLSEAQALESLGPNIEEEEDQSGSTQNVQMTGGGTGQSESRSFPVGGGGFLGGGPIFPPRPRITRCGAMPQDNKWCYGRCEHIQWSFQGCQHKSCMFRPQTGISSCGMEVQILQHYRNVKSYPARQCVQPNRPCNTAPQCDSHTCKKYGRNPSGYCPRTRCQQRYARITLNVYARPKCGGRYKKMPVTVKIPVGCGCHDVVGQRACSCPFRRGQGSAGLGGLMQTPVNPFQGGFPGLSSILPSHGNDYYYDDYYGNQNYGNQNYGNYNGGLGQFGIC